MIECHICIVEFFFSYRRTHIRRHIAGAVFQIFRIDDSQHSEKLHPHFRGVFPVDSGIAAVKRQDMVIVSIPVKENCGSGGFQVGTAGDSLRGPFRFVQCRQKHPRKNGDDRYYDEELYKGENFCFPPGSKNRGTGNSEVRRNGKTLEQSNIGTIQQWNEERRSEVGQELTAFSLGDRSKPRITTDLGIGNKIMAGESLREALKNICIITGFGFFHYLSFPWFYILQRSVLFLRIRSGSIVTLCLPPSSRILTTCLLNSAGFWSMVDI